jgi:hypothetical protein
MLSVMAHPSAQRFSDFLSIPFNGAGMSSGSSNPFANSSMYNAWASITDESHKVRAAEPLQGIVAGLEQPHYGGGGDNILVSFSRPAPLGWVLHVSSNHSAVQLPQSYSVPQGAYNVFVPFVSETVKEATEVTISASLCGQTISASLIVLPPNQ